MIPAAMDKDRGLPFSKKKLFVAGCLLIAFAAFWQLRGNAVRTAGMTEFYREYFARLSPAEAEELQRLESETRQRALFYERSIEQQGFLLQGMVVNRSADGLVADQCDSLLFSSLRFVALKKLGEEDLAKQAWRAILASRRGGQWFRHPICDGKSTSRDMIVGLMAALTQKPEGYREILRELIAYAGENRGYIGDGPFYVSYLSPGLAEILRHFARIEGFPEYELPAVIRYGFSTMELDTYIADVGYQLHLLGLVLWIEQEIARLEKASKSTPWVRGVPIPLERVTRALWGVKVLAQRWPWLAQRLVDADPGNMFYRWLRLGAAEALSAKARLTMLRELDIMPAFPRERLPNRCDRTADYLWQRSSYQYIRRAAHGCAATFAGVDYLWMASLLTSPDYHSPGETRTAATQSEAAKPAH